MIYRLRPFAVDLKHFGQFYNDHCSIVPNDEDWIEITDYDVMILCPESFAVIDEVVATNDHRFEVYGAFTNRCALENQMIRVQGHDIAKHRTYAKRLADAPFPEKIKPVEKMSGHYVLFQKSYWLNNPIVKMPLISGTTWDTTFCRGAQGRLGLINGLYVYHQYRLGMRNTKDKSHLRDR